MATLEPANKAFWLSRLCESNYAKLAGLVPHLSGIEKAAIAEVPGKPSLHMNVKERCPYTLTLELTHSFTDEGEFCLEPGLQLRVYLDARSVEVLSDTDRPSVTLAVDHFGDPRKVLDYKWNLNYFLSRWLDHCQSSNYRFIFADTAEPLVSSAMAL